MGARKGAARGGQPARTRVVQVLANPEGNRTERRAAAKVARMSKEKADKLPMAAETPKPGRWTDRAAGRNGR
jgi:hypothetical protein